MPPGAWTQFFDTLDGDAVWNRREAADYCTRLARLLSLDGSQRVLDFGCGPGLVAARLAPRTAEYLYWDAAPRLRAHTAARLAGLANARLLDLERQPAPGPVADVILMNSVVQYLTTDELRAWLPRWRVLLRPGGRIIASDVIVAPEGVAGALLETLRFLAAQRVPLRSLWSGLGQMRRYTGIRRGAPLSIVPLERLTAWAAEAGLALSVAPENLTFRQARKCVLLADVECGA
jgi:SAM-dependent methyltransferase